MSITITSVNEGEVTDPVIKKTVDSLTDVIKINILHGLIAEKDPILSKLIVGPISALGNNVPSVAEVILNDKIRKLKPLRRKKVLNEFTKPMFFTAALKDKLHSFQVDLKAQKYAYKQIDLQREFSFFNDNFYKSLENRIELLFNINHESQAVGRGNRALRLRLHEVKCIDETGQWDIGQDEIALGGVATDDKGVESVIREFFVKNFDDGEKKNYTPQKILKTFNLNGGNYPKTFSAFISLVEKDWGGFSSFLTKLYKAIRDEIYSIFEDLGQAVGQAVGAAIAGAAGGAIGGSVGHVLGIVAGMVFDQIVNWFIGIVGDEIFTPKITAVTLKNANATFQGGSLTTPTMTFNFREHGGHYKVEYSWQIIR